jgi:DNA-3-methyladenine glycosylase
LEAARLTREFFGLPTLQVARGLLGKRLVRVDNGLRLAGYIVEAEAYIGEADLGCHAKAGRTRRTQVMYSAPGHAYVYFTYGMHWMLNFVTEPAGSPAAVLIRAIFPSEGVEQMAARRVGQPTEHWTDGPAKLCQAMGIDKQLNGSDACDPQTVLFVEEGVLVPDSSVTTGPRVGLYSVPEPWKSVPWRFIVRAPLLFPPFSSRPGEVNS